MKKIVNECVGCTDVGLHCLGDSCRHRNVTRFYCDECGFEDVLYHYEGKELCQECLMKNFDIVDGNDDW